MYVKIDLIVGKGAALEIQGLITRCADHLDRDSVALHDQPVKQSAPADGPCGIDPNRDVTVGKGAVKQDRPASVETVDSDRIVGKDTAAGKNRDTALDSDAIAAARKENAFQIDRILEILFDQERPGKRCPASIVRGPDQGQILALDPDLTFICDRCELDDVFSACRPCDGILERLQFL